VLHNIEEIKQNASLAIQDEIDLATDTNTTKAGNIFNVQRIES